jgi:hypothetical protein
VVERDADQSQLQYVAAALPAARDFQEVGAIFLAYLLSLS